MNSTGFFERNGLSRNQWPTTLAGLLIVLACIILIVTLTDYWRISAKKTREYIEYAWVKPSKASYKTGEPLLMTSHTIVHKRAAITWNDEPVCWSKQGKRIKLKVQDWSSYISPHDWRSVEWNYYGHVPKDMEMCRMCGALTLHLEHRIDISTEPYETAMFGVNGHGIDDKIYTERRC